MSITNSDANKKIELENPDRPDKNAGSHTASNAAETMTKELIAEYSPLDNDNNINSNELKKANEILRSGVCTKLIMHYRENRDENNQNAQDKIDKSEIEAANIMGTVQKTFIELSKTKLLDNLKTIEIVCWDNLMDEFFEAISRLPRLHSVMIGSFSIFDCDNGDALVQILANQSLEKLTFEAIQIGERVDTKKLQEVIMLGKIKELSLVDFGVTDAILEVLSYSKTLIKLDLSGNLGFTVKGLKALADNSIITSLILFNTTPDIQGTLALIRTNRLEVFGEPLPTVNEGSNFGSFSSEQLEEIDKAFEENTSLFRVGISFFDKKWGKVHSTYRSFYHTANDAERLLSIPIVIDEAHSLSSYDKAYTWTHRNRALREACENPAVFSNLRGRIFQNLVNYLGSASDIVPTITDYARPVGTELVQVFNEEMAEQLFPKQLPVLRQFDLYKKSNTTADPKTPSDKTATNAVSMTPARFQVTIPTQPLVITTSTTAATTTAVGTTTATTRSSLI